MGAAKNAHPGSPFCACFFQSVSFFPLAFLREVKARQKFSHRFSIFLFFSIFFFLFLGCNISKGMEFMLPRLDDDDDDDDDESIKRSTTLARNLISQFYDSSSTGMIGCQSSLQSILAWKPVEQHPSGTAPKRKQLTTRTQLSGNK